MKPVKPTTRGVSRFLTAAGFDRSTSYASMIRGWPNWTDGFTVYELADGGVEVQYRDYSSARNTREKTWRMASVLLGRFDVKMDRHEYLKVTAKAVTR